ncbi:MAG: phosphodiester glycosidase family protein [Heliobacteriaceae bacterium]|jgi:hypothetical protein|nr:phosphodiester glycosidase family protein [Heliobacteriaceae bacterium]
MKNIQHILHVIPNLFRNLAAGIGGRMLKQVQHDIVWIILLFILVGIPAFAKPPIDICYDNGIYHIVLKGKKIKKRIKFISSEDLITNREAHAKSRARLTVNAGFFDPKNGKTVSYIVTDRNTEADPVFNENLIGNHVLQQNMDKILNRTEFRVLECHKEGYVYEITPHKSPVDFGCMVVTSAQGGPLVYPQLRLEEEFFVVMQGDKVVRDSISALKKVPRTIIGLKNTDEVHILIITDENPMDLYEVHELCKELGLDRAMAFDGGGSTSMDYLDKYHVISENDGTGRNLKSFMLVY